jgi:hypothetical protein
VVWRTVSESTSSWISSQYRLIRHPLPWVSCITDPASFPYLHQPSSVRSLRTTCRSLHTPSEGRNRCSRDSTIPTELKLQRRVGKSGVSVRLHYPAALSPEKIPGYQSGRRLDRSHSRSVRCGIEKFSCPYWESNLGCPAYNRSLNILSYPVSSKQYKKTRNTIHEINTFLESYETTTRLKRYTTYDLATRFN